MFYREVSLERQVFLEKDATFEDFLSFIETEFDERLVNNFIEIGQYDTDFETQSEFLESEMVVDTLRKQWERNKPEEWGHERDSLGRLAEGSALETLRHSFTSIKGHADIYVWNLEGLLEDLSPEEVAQIWFNVDFLESYFNLRFRNIISNHSDK